MSKLNDSSAIKLFGKTIPFPILNQEEASADHVGNAAREDANLVSSSNSLTGVISNDGIQAMVPREKQVSVEKELVKDKKEDNSSHQIREDLNAPTNLSDIGDNATSPSPERKTSSAKGSKNDEISETTSSQDKTLKKPDKILPCPRCNSKETKFCYYNNYNVNQPRHFCKNCQRYWTAGGTMRNVPVGAGRRKTKTSSALQYHHIIISEAIRAAQAGIHPNPSCENKNAHILGFGSNSFNIPGKAQINVQKGFHRPEQRVPFEDNRSNESLINASYPLQNEGKAGFNQAEQVKNLHWLRPAKAPSFPRPSWPYPWDSIPAIIPPPPPPLFPPGFPASFDRPPATYSSYSVPNPWDVPVASPSPASSVNQCPPRSNPTSPTLGKHSREVNILNKEKLSILKTLRIDDSDETAKSSMLATLVAKNKKINSSNSGGLFEGFQSKASDERNYRLETFSVMRANPAALSRSVNFHENT